MNGSLGVDGEGPGHSVWTEEGQVTRCGRRRARSLGVDGGGSDHSVWMEEVQVTRCGWRKARSLGVDGGRPTTKETAEAMKQPCCMKIGRPKLRWEECAKRIVRKEEDGRRRLPIGEMERYNSYT